MPLYKIILEQTIRFHVNVVSISESEAGIKAVGLIENYNAIPSARSYKPATRPRVIEIRGSNEIPRS